MRGVRPNNQDISLAQRMAYNVAEYAKEGKRGVMPAIRGDEDFSLPFDVIGTENAVKGNIMKVANRLLL